MGIPLEPSALRHLNELTREYLQTGTRVRIRVTGSSMYPTLKSGEIVRVDPLKGKQPRRGDLLCYPSGDRLIIHRLRSKDADGNLLCGGDFYKQADPLIAPSLVLGTVRFKWSNARTKKPPRRIRVRPLPLLRFIRPYHRFAYRFTR
ncbi:MAG: S24/S26 family peptidase [Bacteroidales bacterium]